MVSCTIVGRILFESVLQKQKLQWELRHALVRSTNHTGVVDWWDKSHRRRIPMQQKCYMRFLVHVAKVANSKRTEPIYQTFKWGFIKRLELLFWSLISKIGPIFLRASVKCPAMSSPYQKEVSRPVQAGCSCRSVEPPWTISHPHIHSWFWNRICALKIQRCDNVGYGDVCSDTWYIIQVLEDFENIRAREVIIEWTKTT